MLGFFVIFSLYVVLETNGIEVVLVYRAKGYDIDIYWHLKMIAEMKKSITMYACPFVYINNEKCIQMTIM